MTISKTIILVILNILINVQFMSAQKETLPLPSKAQLRWQQHEQIMFVHISPATWQGREYDNHSYPISKINPSKLNTDQWCEVANSWGAKQIVFVAKHVGGFCWWQTNTTDYSIKNIPWKNGKGDVLKDLSESCKKYGLDLGVYIYPGDDQWGAGIGSGGITSDPSKQAEYNRVFRQQLTEVLTKYGPIHEVWFDGNCQIPVGDILDKYASDAVIFQGEKANIRWVGNEDGVAPDPNWYTVKKSDLNTGVSTALHSDVNGDCYAPIEVDVPILNNKGHKWFWAPGTDHLLMTVEQLMKLYYKSVGRGSVLLLNSNPDTTGLIPKSHVRRYAEFGREIKKRFSSPVSKTSGMGREFILSFSEPTIVNHCILQEDLKKGQRIRSYILEGADDSGVWKTLAKGTSVGNKKIDYFKSVPLKKIRLTITDAKAIPNIRNFSAFHVVSNINDVIAMDKQEHPVVISTWDDSTYSKDKWKEVEFDLTPYVNSIGQYEISFNVLAYDFNNNSSTGLQFKEWKLEMYGKSSQESISKLEGKDVFRITRSQQTLDEYPTKLKIKIRRNPSASTGEVTIKRLVF